MLYDSPGNQWTNFLKINGVLEYEPTITVEGGKKKGVFYLTQIYQDSDGKNRMALYRCITYTPKCIELLEKSKWKCILNCKAKVHYQEIVEYLEIYVYKIDEYLRYGEILNEHKSD